MDLKILENFCTVARTLNITNAANSLYMSQPTLSRQIHAMEKELGTQLFYMENRNLRLTEAGETLYNESQRFLSDWAQILQIVKTAADSGMREKENVDIETYSEHVDALFKLCQSYQAKNTNIQYNFEQRFMRDIIDDIISAKAGLGCITSVALEEYKQKAHVLGSCIIGRDPVCLVVGKNHPFAKKG